MTVNGWLQIVVFLANILGGRALGKRHIEHLQALKCRANGQRHVAMEQLKRNPEPKAFRAIRLGSRVREQQFDELSGDGRIRVKQFALSAFEQQLERKLVGLLPTLVVERRDARGEVTAGGGVCC